MSEHEPDYIAANRRAWDRSAPHHRASRSFEDLLAGFARPGFSCLDAVATERLAALGVAGKDVAQLCCNNGREILSVKNLGAGSCVGFDQSGAFLAQARELAAAGGLDCRFVEGDVHAIPAAFDGAFDLVLVTIGAFGWMPDLGAFMKVAARLLRPGGAVFAYEEHPIMNMFEPADPADPHRPVNSYFRDKPFVEDNVIVYEGKVAEEGETHYWFVHTLGEVVTACLKVGLAIEHLREYPHNISSTHFDIYEGQAAQLPLSYTLVARKGAAPRQARRP
jgi:SAM-dependent methyltransferase